ncbi:hypothetical protein BJ986_002947 [Phycicoccus badiiscoriae]|uniref:Uncharacterized protein n=1 Tax=Pedococcus badiiscoriae TaxID=642776 RepID=A0A852WHU8_9MICO|nr:hypothetical protein [Pedococcus badiiscoriae]NYG08460.1 hypothetical protein [Pedococcus badiiscoriae]
MASESVVSDLTAAANAIKALSTDEDRFRALFDAFRATDADSYLRLLEEAKVSDRAELVCGWLCSKDCVLRCLELCGPPRDEVVPDVRELADLIVKVTQDEELVERLAGSVVEPDAKAWQALVAELKAERLCHLLCHWVCTVHCRLRCDRLDTRATLSVRHLVDELTAAGGAIRDLLADKGAFAEATKAALAGDCELMRGVLTRAKLDSRCQWVCELFCTWRCIRVCIELCRQFPLEKADTSLSEAYAFAQATARLVKHPEVLTALVDAVEQADAAKFAEIVTKLELQRFCIQLCHWVCSWHCRLLCRCVCHPVRAPFFTQVGHFNITSDISSSTGLTNKGLAFAGLYYGGGPGFAFQGLLELRGYCPADSPIDGTAMKYRFLLAGSNTPVTGGRVGQVDVGSRMVNWPKQDGSGTTIAGTDSIPQSLVIAGSPQVDATPPNVGDPWTGPGIHTIVPDGDGWVVVDPGASAFTTLMGLESTVDAPGGAPLPGSDAGQAVLNPRSGQDLGIVFEATRVSNPMASPPDYTNSLTKLHVNNWGEVNELSIQQFANPVTLGCTPIDSALDVDYTADHELMAAWDLSITSFSSSAPGSVASGTVPRGQFGTVSEVTTSWKPCSYLVSMSTRAALTTGLIDNQGTSSQITFCVGVHGGG